MPDISDIPKEILAKMYENVGNPTPFIKALEQLSNNQKNRLLDSEGDKAGDYCAELIKEDGEQIVQLGKALAYFAPLSHIYIHAYKLLYESIRDAMIEIKAQGLSQTGLDGGMEIMAPEHSLNVGGVLLVCKLEYDDSMKRRVNNIFEFVENLDDTQKEAGKDCSRYKKIIALYRAYFEMRKGNEAFLTIK